MGERMDVAALDGSGSFSVYRALPAGTPKAAIIVIQEIFGVNAGIRRKADDWAELGYLALAPDMFWRFAPGYDVDPDNVEQMQDAFEVRKKFNFDKGIQDVEAVIRAARALMSGGKVGLVGFCLGGGVAYLAATRTDIDASVGFYGAAIPGYLGEAHSIAKPLLLHFAELDHFIPEEGKAAIEATLGANPHVTIEHYPGVDHGFADTFGKRRSAEQAEIAEARTRDFFAATLA